VNKLKEKERGKGRFKKSQRSQKKRKRRGGRKKRSLNRGGSVLYILGLKSMGKKSEKRGTGSSSGGLIKKETGRGN